VDLLTGKYTPFNILSGGSGLLSGLGSLLGGAAPTLAAAAIPYAAKSAYDYFRPPNTEGQLSTRPYNLP
jgi:hypothetical protein